MVYEVKLYQSDELTTYCSETYGREFQAAENAADAIEGVFAEIDGKDVSVDVSSETVTVPTYHWSDGRVAPVSENLVAENIYVGNPSRARVPRSTPHPEYGDETYEVYTSGGRWWREYMIHNLDTATHSNILLSAAGSTNTGLATSGTSAYAVANTGKACAEYDPSEGLRGRSDGLNGIQTVIHELGHNLLKNDDEFEGYSGNSHCRSQHSMGTVEVGRWWFTYETPMSAGSLNDCMFNNHYCGSLAEIPVTGQSLVFSDCAVSMLEDPNNW